MSSELPMNHQVSPKSTAPRDITSRGPQLEVGLLRALSRVISPTIHVTSPLVKVVIVRGPYLYER